MLKSMLLLLHFLGANESLENCDLSQFPSDKLAMLEADCFWCVSKLLDGIQVCFVYT